VYNDPAYAPIVKKLHKDLVQLRLRYGDSKELDKKYMDLYKKKNN
jgi:hypothetical protein